MKLIHISVILGTRSVTGIQGIMERVICPWIPAVLRTSRMTE